ncbi:MAG TPA: response regulator [Vicinamibacteria bacterium]|nr:response regulator [Vicinamibacteria bacterium]
MKKKKILLVDDSKTALLMEQMILKKHSYDVVLAQDGAEAVAKATSERPDLILMDVVMPRMTGLEAVQELRRHEATKAIPIIMVSTRGEGASVEAGFESGCNEYMTKPIDGPTLIAKIRDYLGE